VSVGHYENFPVASLLLPAPLREPVAVIYRFARSADDIADEGDDPRARRLEKLDDYRRQLDAPSHPLLRDVARIARQHRLPLQLFRDLLDAFSQDVTKPRYADFDELLDYCRRSANPVGRLVLRNAAGGERAHFELVEGRLGSCRCGPLAGESAFYQVFDALGITLRGALNGAGDTRYVTAVLGVMAVFVVTDVARRLLNRRKGQGHE